jgi:hypothetical protein
MCSQVADLDFPQLSGVQQIINCFENELVNARAFDAPICDCAFAHAFGWTRHLLTVGNYLPTLYTSSGV